MKIKRTKQGLVFCPKCKSFNVQKEIHPGIVFGAPSEWMCNNCGFRNYLFPQVHKNTKKLKK